jgi:molecular chaperone GrpE
MAEDIQGEETVSSSSRTVDEWEAENARLREETLHLEQAIVELKAKQDQLLRTAASYDNSRRRAERDLEDAKRYGIEKFAKKLLPVADSLRRALDASQTSTDVEALREGVVMVLKQLEDALETEGILPIPAVGEPFDPNLHEAVAQHPTNDVPENTIVAELQRGYTLNDRLLRASSVLVAMPPTS